MVNSSVKIIKYLALILPLLVGCTDKVNYDFPGDIKPLCNAARDNSKACIQRKGIKLDKECSVKITKVMTCDRKASSGYWCWYDPTWKMYVGGLCGDGWIKIGCNPQTGGEVHEGVTTHEFGHHWLDCNKVGGMHIPQVKSCFINWNNPDTRNLAQITNEEWISVNTVDSSGAIIHYDFVVFK